MTAPAPRPTSLRQQHIEYIQNLFDEPPSLADVAADRAQAYLDLQFAQRNLSAAHIHIAGPTGPYRSLQEWVLERLAVARPTLLVEQFHRVATRVRESYVPCHMNLAEVEVLINQCGAKLLGFYALRLQAWWREALPVNMTRWGHLSDELLELLYDAPRPPGMSQSRFAVVLPKSRLHPRRPNRLWSAHGPALRVQTVHVKSSHRLQTLPVLLFSQPAAAQVVFFSPASGVQVLENLAAVQALLPAHASPLLAPMAGQWFAIDAQGDPFDALAASYLQRQLQEIASLDPTVPRTVHEYQALLATITDSRRWFVPHLSARQQYLREQLPLWLAHAGVDACIAYAQLLQALVLDRQQHGYQHFLDGVPTLQHYARERLQTCLRNEPRAATLIPDEIVLSFEQVIAAAVPVQGGFIAGEVHTLNVSLTELAQENLAGFAHTAKSIRLKGLNAPAWLTYDLLKACVSEVDIGQSYPALLKKHLIDDLADATRRRQRFSQQLRIQLPMQALEWQIKGEHGLTHSGFRRLRAALQASAGERMVDGQSIALWPLAFKATAAAPPDAVANMFIIGPHHGEDGCHLLYRPLFEPALQEFASLDALFDAIKRPGAVQDSVLTWIDSRRQQVYANNGFREPHVRHFLPSDEFTRYEKPPPAQLSKTVSSADPAHQLFAAMAQALVALADRQTVSNAEQRWASVKQIGWLLFGTLQPLLSGPLMLVGWLVQLLDSAEQDIVGLQSTDPQARNIAVMDMLANVMVILAHQATPHDLRQHVDLEPPVFAPLAVPESPPMTPALIPPPAGFTAPMAWANARSALTPQLRARLETLSLKRFPEPWPKALPGAEKAGPWQGLLRDSPNAPTQWQALVRGCQYRVRIENGEVRVTSADGTRPGPWLKSVAPGVWDVDLRLRLSGGADAGSDVPVDTFALETQYQQAIGERVRLQRTMEIARNLAQQPTQVIDEEQRSRAQASYRDALERKVESSLKELQLLRRLRELAPRPGYEQELSQLLESTVLTLQLLDLQCRAPIQQANTQATLLLSRSEQSRTEDAHAELNQAMRTLAASYERAIHWRSLEHRYLDELGQVPRFGRDKALALIDATPRRPSLFDLQSLQLRALWGLAIDVPGSRFEEELLASLTQTIDRAHWATRSLAELAQLQASDAERIEVLDSVDRVLAQTDDRIEFWRTMDPDNFNAEYLDKLQALFSALHQHVERNLGALLQTTASASPTPSVPVAAEGGRRKKIIRTRNRDLFVARTEPASSTTAQMTDDTGSVIGTFTEAADGVWEQTTRAPASRPDPELGSLMKTASTLLQDMDKAIANVDALTSRANDPVSLQDLLEAQARRRTWVADAIAEKLRSAANARLAAVQQANARATQAQLRAAAVRLNEAGLSARIRATRGKVLSQDDVAFLHEHHEVRVVRQGARVALRERREDYLQVYAVIDVHTGKALAYAHFHYTRQQGPDDHFTAAHLKVPEQERLGRQAQAQVEAEAFARMRSGQAGRVRQTLEIRRSVIQLPLARRLFFSVD